MDLDFWDGFGREKTEEIQYPKYAILLLGVNAANPNKNIQTFSVKFYKSTAIQMGSLLNCLMQNCYG